MSELMSIIQCQQCRRNVRIKDTLTVHDQHDGRAKRLCRDCLAGFYLNEINAQGFGHKRAKLIKLWTKDIKDGK